MRGLLFLCGSNSCRSQIAEGFARHLLPDGVAVYSAGSHPGHVHPRAIEAMHEVGIDIPAQRSKGVEQIPLDAVDCVITLCAEAAEASPAFIGDVQRLHWPLPDRAAAQGSPEEVMVTFRAVRDELARRIRRLASEVATRDH